MAGKRLFQIIAILFLGFLIHPGEGEAAQQRLLGLHDRILPIDDIRVTHGDTKVPLEEIKGHLYLPVETKDGQVVFEKYGKVYAFNPKTGKTSRGGVELGFQPMEQIDGKTYISVKFIAQEVGLKFYYFKPEKTIRIYRDRYISKTHEQFKQVIEAYRAKQNQGSEKPPVAGTKGKTVYLTFDDGPTEYTLTNVKTLNRYGLPATFFFIGNQMKRNPSIVKKVASEGFYIGSHSMTHNEKVLYSSTKNFMKEMNDSFSIIEKITGKPSQLARVPYGSKPWVTPSMRKQLKANGYKLWDWNVDSNDWRYNVSGVDQIIANVKNGVRKVDRRGGKNIVILMHDRVQTTKALPSIIEWLKAEGYSFAEYDPDHHVVMNFFNDRQL